MATPPLRIGVLGAARIVPFALLGPARDVPEVTVAAIAARDPRRAAAMARRHGIPRIHIGYEDVLADPDIDAIYVPLPNALHAEYSVRALQAGKHVLCEKPLAANAGEAERMAEAAARAGRVLMEAFHYRYHPLAVRMKEIVNSGVLGPIHRLEAALCFPVVRLHDIRYSYALGGGATMDAGCYAVHMVRFLAGAEPSVAGARAVLASARIDRRMTADLRFADGRTARITCSLFSSALLRIRVRVQGERGEMRVANPLLPHLWHRLVVRTPQGVRVERVPGDRTYTHQLRAFAHAATTGEAPPTGPADAVANMRVIDAIYRTAGLQPRGT